MIFGIREPVWYTILIITFILGGMFLIHKTTFWRAMNVISLIFITPVAFLMWLFTVPFAHKGFTKRFWSANWKTVKEMWMEEY
jgi:hypothetical protein